MTSPTLPSSPKSELSQSSDPDMDQLTLSMDRHALSDGSSPLDTTPTGPRINSNGHYSCQGCTVDGKLCNSDGVEVVQLQQGIGRYCFQHNPKTEDQICLAYNKNRRKGEKEIVRCGNKCSTAGEIREDGRPICNNHHKWGAKLIDGSTYPPHSRTDM